MSFLSANDRAQITHLFESLSGEVRLIYFTQRESPLFLPGHECETWKDTRILLDEVAGSSDKLHLEVHDFVSDSQIANEYGIDRIPALAITAEGLKGKVRYFGMPSGYELSSLLGSLRDASQGKTDLSEGTLETLQTLNKEVHIQVFVTPT